MIQQGDVTLFQTNDDGDITVTNGIVEMSGGLETAAYLSLFGGNEDDAGLTDIVNTWWANLDEIDPTFQFRSETQHLLEALAATTGNLRRIEDAAIKDLAWFIEKGVASEVTVTASMPGLNRVALTINIDQNELEFIENWRVNT